MNTAFILLFALAFVFVVTFSFMTPIDRRMFIGIVWDAWDTAYHQVVRALSRVKDWWDERRAKKS